MESNKVKNFNKKMKMREERQYPNLKHTIHNNYVPPFLLHPRKQKYILPYIFTYNNFSIEKIVLSRSLWTPF